MNKIISHRGNLSGPDPELENKLEQIEALLKTTDFDVEIDVREVNDVLFLGHDDMQEAIPITFILNNSDRLWVHCKNLGAYKLLCGYRNFGSFTVNFFFHDKDPCALTSHGWLWGYPNAEIFGKDISDHYVHVILEDWTAEDYVCSYKNVCTDHPLNYKDKWTNF